MQWQIKVSQAEQQEKALRLEMSQLKIKIE